MLSLWDKDCVGFERTDLDWRIYPEGIYRVLKSLGKYNLPIYITENGIADADDSKRTKFIFDHLKYVHKAISEGVDVRGYFHWSLIDNFEFPDMRGFWPRFGLVEVDYKTLERKPRKSFYEYAKICQNNEVDLTRPD
jgi:beta-glucosidase